MCNHMTVKRILLYLHLVLVLIPLALTGCSDEETSVIQSGCLGCHPVITDTSHQLDCALCHQGDETATTRDKAHQSLIAQPAHPDTMQQYCGSCHPAQLAASQTLHLKQDNLVNMVRSAFGETVRLDSLIDIPVVEQPATIGELADDLLRRRCLRCHLYNQGDDYPATHHGTGCAACHLKFQDNKLQSHEFLAKPEDSICLSCHYGNRVGFDYYGRFEHDFHDEYRTPFNTADHSQRPFGVEYRQLKADIHQEKGLGCIDCHGANELMQPRTDSTKLQCTSCHLKGSLEKQLPEGVKKTQDGNYTFTASTTNSLHQLPVMKHHSHFGSYATVSCQVCHAQWSYNDTETHLLRSDVDEYDQYHALVVQGSSEIESFLVNNLDYEKDELEPEMSDKLTGEMRQGVWYKSYSLRRWEEVILGRDEVGQLTVLRPQLNLSLSWLNDEEVPIFDSVKSLTPNNGLTPYTPHTTGAAGIYYETRILQFLESESIKATATK